MLHTTRKFLSQHPLTRNRQCEAWWRVFRWQVISRLRDEVVVDWIDGARLAVRHGMKGATGNIYAGLHEFGDMAFLLHLLRPGDLFLDAGANVGTFTVLAAKVCRAEALAVEPDPETMQALRRNVALNDIEDSVQLANVALGRQSGTAEFTVGLDTVNHVIGASGSSLDAHRTVALVRVDELLAGKVPSLIKLDVEGYEAEVLAGAQDTLRDPALLAVQSETSDEAVVQILTEAGLRRVFYDPFARILSPEPTAVLAANALFVRDIDTCKQRCCCAPRRRVLHSEI